MGRLVLLLASNISKMVYSIQLSDGLNQPVNVCGCSHMAVQKSDHFNKQQPFFAHFSQEPPASVPEWRLPSFNMMLD